MIDRYIDRLNIRVKEIQIIDRQINRQIDRWIDKQIDKDGQSQTNLDKNRHGDRHGQTGLNWLDMDTDMDRHKPT